jgi:hypothetical protein
MFNLPHPPLPRFVRRLLCLSLFLAALFWLSPLVWAGGMALFAAVLAWEWGELAGLESQGRRVCGGLMLLICLGVIFCAPGSLTLQEGMLEGRQIFAILNLPWDDGEMETLLALIAFRTELLIALAPGMLFYFFAALFWCLIAPSGGRWRLLPLWLSRRLPPRGQIACEKGELLFSGFWLILAAWFASIQLRAFHPGVLLMALGIVWVAALGDALGNMLAAKLSGWRKTWAGGLCALTGVALYAVGLATFVRLNYVTKFYREPLWLTVIIFLFLALWGIMGARYLSRLKHQAGIPADAPRFCERCGALLAVLPGFAVTFVFLVVYAPLPRQ